MQSEAPEVDEPTLGEVDRLGRSPGEHVRLDEVVPGRADALGVVALDGEGERLVEAADAVVVASEMAFERAEHVQGVADLRSAPHLSGCGESVTGEGEGVEIAQFEGGLVGDAAQPGDDRQRDPGLAALGHRHRRPLGGRQVTGVPRVQRPPIEDPGVALRLSVRIELGDQLIGELHGAVVAPGQRGDLGGVLEQPEAVDPGDRRGVGDPRPELREPAGSGPAASIGAWASSAAWPARTDAANDSGDSSGGMPVMGELARRQRRIVTEGQLRMSSQGDGDTLVERRPFARQEVAVHGLVAEGVAERVQVAGAHHQLAAEGVAQRRVDGGGVEIDDLAQQRVAEPTPDDGGDAQQLSGSARRRW